MKLLIIDDEVITTEVLKEQLDREYLELDAVYTAYNIAMAKKLLEENKIEIILCDVEMPQGNGLELLEWVRQYRKDIEFLFLTSHEKFEYTLGAIQNGAANYLLKPVDMAKVTQAVYTVVQKIKKMQQMNEIKGYWSYGKRKAIRNFWENAVWGELQDRSTEIKEEILRLGLELEEKYTLVMFHLRKETIFKNRESKSLEWFILDNIIAELLTVDFKMENIINRENGEEFYLIAVSEMNTKELKENMEPLKEELKKYYKDPICVGYISDQKKIFELGQMREELLQYDKEHVYEKGEIFVYSELGKKSSNRGKQLDSKFIIQCLERGERVKLLEYLQKIISSNREKDHSLAGMQYFQLELIQIVGGFLHKQEMDMEIFLADPFYLDIQKQAFTSEFAMIRWNAYYINKVFDCMPDRNKSRGMVDIIVDYIRKHYEENISRNTLADLVHFTPEYVGKMFKKEMGVSINDYINTLRIAKAKDLMVSTNYKIIDIALMVGFDNMPYFSSVFKKYEGISPAEYKKINGR